MAGDNGHADQAGATPKGGRIVITFGPEDPTSPAVTAEDVSMGQVMAAAMLLDMWARELRSGQVARMQLGGLVIPRPGGQPVPGRT